MKESTNMKREDGDTGLLLFIKFLIKYIADTVKTVHLLNDIVFACVFIGFRLRVRG